MNTLLPISAACALAIAFAGCASASDPPLGGPYGGTSSSTTSSADPTDPTADDAGASGSSSSSGGTSGSASSSSSTSSSSSSSSSGSTSSSSSGSSGASSTSSSSSSSGSSGSSTSSSGSSGSTTPTWTSIYTSYLAKGTIGNCAASGCHSQMSSATGAYSWLQGRGQISATNAKLADPQSSRLSWLGGDMPPSGPSSNAAATSDLTAWAAAGAPDN